MGEKKDYWPICNVALNDEGPHVITIDANATEEHPFYVDFIRYQPVWEDRETLHPTVVLDNTDPAITYDSGNWKSYIYKNETMLTVDRGARATVEFHGTKATWVGWIISSYPAGASTGTWSIDGGGPVQFEIPGLPSDANETLYFQNFFETPRLRSRGPHKLVVTHMGPSAPLTLDHLIIEDGDIDVPPGEAKVIGSTAGGMDSPTPVGTILGGVVGGLTFLAVCALLTFFAIRRQKKKHRMANEDLPLITPLMPPENNDTSTSQGPSRPPRSGMLPSQRVRYPYQPLPSPGMMPTKPSLSSVPTSNNSAVPMLYTKATNPNFSRTWSSPKSSAFSSQHSRQHSFPPYPQPQSTVHGHDSNTSSYYRGSGGYPAGLRQHQQRQYRQSQVLPNPTTPSSLRHALPKSMVDLRGSQWTAGGGGASSTPDADSFPMHPMDRTRHTKSTPSKVRIIQHHPLGKDCTGAIG
ncbi:hypothetical protein CC2G_003549 [Coprinopsis cinerea AmutBmut pab1-1]|nr:hypothetical protein CC2G_003549 [Coprinopsis cinerea AmutBmut pab1-1]